MNLPASVVENSWGQSVNGCLQSGFVSMDKGFIILTDSISPLTSKVAQATAPTLKNIALIQGDTHGFSKMLVFTSCLIKAVQLTGIRSSERFTDAQKTLSSADDAIDISSFFCSDMHYFFCGGFKKDLLAKELNEEKGETFSTKRIQLGARVSFAFAEGIKTFGWFKGQGVSFGKFANEMGSSRVFRGLSFYQFGLATCIAGFSLDAIRLFKQLCHEKAKDTEVMFASLISRTADCMQKSLIFVGRCNPLVHVSLGLLATGSQIYAILNDNAK